MKAQEAEAGTADQASEEESKEGGKESPKTFDESYVKSLRSEAAKYRKEAQEAQKQLKDREDADKSELEKAQNRIAELEKSDTDTASTIQGLRVENAVLREAGGLGITNLKAAQRLIDREALQFDDDGQPQNTESLLKELIKEYPGIVGTPTPPPTEFDGGPRAPAPSNLTPEEAHGRLLAEQVFGVPQQNE